MKSDGTNQKPSGFIRNKEDVLGGGKKVRGSSSMVWYVGNHQTGPLCRCRGIPQRIPQRQPLPSFALLYNTIV